MKIKNFTPSLLISAFALFIIFQSCVDPIDPEFDYKDNLVFVDGYALTEPGISFVSIKRSVFQNERYTLESVSGASVKIENTNTGELITFLEDEAGTYACPSNFACTEGESWKLFVELVDGRKIESDEELVTKPVEIDNVVADFSTEVKYDVGANKFLPGHSIKIDWKDPEGVDNFYLWKHRSFETLNVCKTCVRGVYRNGSCVDADIPSFLTQYYDYYCETDCWMIRYGDQLPTFSDRLSDGMEITSREIATVPYYRAENVLVEVQQLTLNKSAYDYFQVINQLVNENSGLNAPPPAALIGNLKNSDEASDVIFGQFTVAGVYTKRIFIDRSNILATPVDPDPNIHTEDCATSPCTAPCEESFFRTAIKPEGWP